MTGTGQGARGEGGAEMVPRASPAGLAWPGHLPMALGLQGQDGRLQGVGQL